MIVLKLSKLYHKVQSILSNLNIKEKSQKNYLTHLQALDIIIIYKRFC